MEVGTNNSKLSIKGPQNAEVIARVAAYLPEQQDENGADIAQRPLDRQPYWNIEPARIRKTRKIPVELIVNGEEVDTIEILADSIWQQVNFNYTMKQSSWVALREFSSCHTNPDFVLMDERPIHVLKSA